MGISHTLVKFATPIAAFSLFFNMHGIFYDEWNKGVTL